MHRPLNIIWSEYTKRLNIYLNEEDPLKEITVNNYEYLCGIYDNAPCTSTDLATAMGHKKSSVSSMIDNLVNKGHVIKLNGEDKRSNFLQLAPHAYDLVRNEYEFYTNYINSLAKHISPEEVGFLGKILDKIAEGIENEKTRL